MEDDIVAKVLDRLGDCYLAAPTEGADVGEIIWQYGKPREWSTQWCNMGLYY